jgi:hypothetical protein
MAGFGDGARSDVLQLFRQVVKGRVAINLIGCRIEKRILLVRAGRSDIFRFYHPDADPFATAGIYIAGVFDSHGGVCGVQTTHMFVIETVFASYKHLP